jgi:hypothetical protein
LYILWNESAEVEMMTNQEALKKLVEDLGQNLVVARLKIGQAILASPEMEGESTHSFLREADELLDDSLMRIRLFTMPGNPEPPPTSGVSGS